MLIVTGRDWLSYFKLSWLRGCQWYWALGQLVVSCSPGPALGTLGAAEQRKLVRIWTRPCMPVAPLGTCRQIRVEAAVEVVVLAQSALARGLLVVQARRRRRSRSQALGTEHATSTGHAQDCDSEQGARPGPTWPTTHFLSGQQLSQCDEPVGSWSWGAWK